MVINVAGADADVLGGGVGGVVVRVGHGGDVHELGGVVAHHKGTWQQH